MLSKHFKLSMMVNLFSWFKIPLLAYIRPKVIRIDDEEALLRVKLNSRTRNHLNVMYFGALAMGAELSVALMIVQFMNEKKKPMEFIFKDFECKFLKRADGHTYFSCPESGAVRKLCEQYFETGDRIESTHSGFAYTNSETKEPIMEYKVTVSMKNRRFKD